MGPAKCFTSSDPPSSRTALPAITSPFYRERNRSSEKISHLFKVTQPGKAGFKLGLLGLQSRLPRDAAATLNVNLKKVGDTDESLQPSNTPKLRLRAS